MFGVICRRAAKRALAIGAGLAAIGLTTVAVPGPASAQPKHEITVHVTKFHALDRADDLSNGDFFARLTIDGKSEISPTLSGQAEFKPDWKLTIPVSGGVHKVKLELIDKDVSVDDPIDINRVANKRDLEFEVNTKSCRIEGFSESYKCGASITRAGAEKKRATITFTVTAK